MPETDLETLERGNLYFFFRPTVEEDPEGIADVQNFYMVMSVHGEDRYRSCIIGRKKLPEPEASGKRRYWGFADAVLEDPKKIVDELKGEAYEAETRGERHQLAARPTGEGIYRILHHEDHTHLVYALELPDEPDEVQRALNLAGGGELHPDRQEPGEAVAGPCRPAGACGGGLAGAAPGALPGPPLHPRRSPRIPEPPRRRDRPHLRLRRPGGRVRPRARPPGGERIDRGDLQRPAPGEVPAAGEAAPGREWD